jgi:hypothetical protein
LDGRAGVSSTPTTASSAAGATTASVTSDAATTPAVALPVFDEWIARPRLDCSLPAIGAWRTVTDVVAERRGSSGDERIVQIVFAQRPAVNPGLSKYSVIFMASELDPTDTIQWRIMATTYWTAFRREVEQSGRFAEIDVTTPTVQAVNDRWRFDFSYRLKMKSGTPVSGAVLALPSRHGMLFYVLALEGHGPASVREAMRDLRVQAVVGLARKPASARPYLIALLIAVPFGLVAVLLLTRPRSHPHPPETS